MSGWGHLLAQAAGKLHVWQPASVEATPQTMAKAMWMAGCDWWRAGAGIKCKDTTAAQKKQ
jgi:hypothetical protein